MISGGSSGLQASISSASTSRQSCLLDQPQIQLWTLRLRWASWLEILRTITRGSWENFSLFTLTGRGHMEVQCVEHCWTLPQARLFLADFNLCTSAVMNPNCEYIILWVFLANYQNWGWSWKPPNLQMPSEWGWFRDFPGHPVVKNPPANAGYKGLSPGLGRSYILQCNWTCVPQLLKLACPRVCVLQQEKWPWWETRALQL